jgi:hypothetical protein
MSQNICMIRETDLTADQLRQVIITFYNNCSVRTTRSPKTVPWWNKKLSGLRAKTTWLFNVAKRTGHWDIYKEALTSYNKEIGKSKVDMEEGPPGDSSCTRQCQTHADHGKTGLALLSYQIVNTLKLEGKLWKSYSESTFPNQHWLMIKMIGASSRTWMYAAAERTGETGTWPGMQSVQN